MARFNFMLNVTDYVAPLYLVAAEMAFALLLALYQLGHDSLWLDETLTAAIVHLDWGSMWHLMADREGNMGAYFVIMHVWVNLGDSEFILRSLSVIFAVACIPAIYLLALRLYGTKVALVAALLMATNAFWLRYAQEARAYSLLLLLSILTTIVFVEAVHKPSWRRWLLFSLTGALTVYVHMLAVLLMGALLLSLFALPRREVPWRMALVGAAVMGALLVPLLVFAMTTEGQAPSLEELTLVSAVRVFSHLAGNRFVLLAVLPFGVLASVAAAREWQRMGPSLANWPWALVILSLLVPIGAGFAISLFRPLVVPRYFTVSLTPLVLLVSVGLAQLRSRSLFVMALGAVVLVSLVADVAYYAESKQDWRAATEFIARGASPEDAIVFFHPATRLSYEYYLAHLDKTQSTPHFETYTAGDSGVLEQRNVLSLPFGHPPDPDEALGSRLASQYDRVWLVLAYGGEKSDRVIEDDVDVILKSLRHSFSSSEEKEFQDLDVVLYSNAD